MSNKSEDLVLDMWKRNLDAALGLFETVVEATTRLRDLQLETATEAHADLEATRKALAAATDLPQLVSIQMNWARANADKSLAYWRSVCECVMQPGATSAAMDDVYGKWLEGVRRLYRPAQKAAA